ncbi:MAG: alpha/beta hydrolase [Candidatus Hodarchaeota archaeon]
MNREKLIKRGKRLKSLYAIYMKLNIFKRRIKGNVRYVDTTHGKIKILEYGFDSEEISPLYIDLHGGGFILMTPDSDQPMNLYIKEKANVKIISIDYPKAPKNPYPIALEAIYEIVEYYLQNASKYGIDPEHVGIGGHSAGANLATVTCIRAKEKGDFSFRFQLLDYPPLDLKTNPYKKPKPIGAVLPWMAVAFNACYTDLETAGSPYVSPIFSTPAQLMGLPPTLLIVAGRDSLHDEGVLYKEMLEKAGVPVEFHDFKKSVHGFTLKKWSNAKKAHAIMADFINRKK